MAYCPNCGIEVSGKFCQNCGTMVGDEVRNSAGQGNYNAPPYGAGGAQNNAGAYSQPGMNQNNGGAYSQPGYQNNQGYYSNPGYQNNQGGYYQPGMNKNGMGAAPGYNQSSDPNSYKLGWHKFLVYFALFASGVLTIISSISWFRLAPYVPALAIIGVVEVALAAFIVYVRFPLAGFKKGAPKLLIIAYAATVGINIIVMIVNIYYTVQYYSGFGMAADLSSNILLAVRSVVVPLVMLFVNWKYYSNRQALFVR